MKSGAVREFELVDALESRGFRSWVWRREWSGMGVDCINGDLAITMSSGVLVGFD